MDVETLFQTAAQGARDYRDRIIDTHWTLDLTPCWQTRWKTLVLASCGKCVPEAVLSDEPSCPRCKALCDAYHALDVA